MSDQSITRVQRRLSELGLSLPAAPRPVAAYVPFVRSGNLKLELFEDRDLVP